MDQSELTCIASSRYLGLMPIELSPETEALIQQDIRRGPYRNAADFVERAVAILHAQEEWLSESRAQIAESLEAGYASAQRGDLADEDQVRSRMTSRKQVWLAQSRGPA